MTIDEAIKNHKYEAKKCREEIIKAEYLEPQEKYYNSQCVRLAEEHEQLAEWLELLKWYQQGMEDIPSESGVLPKDVYRAGYIKAIDDFKRIICEELKLYIDHEDYMCVGLSLHKFTRDLAEQLKEGGKDE